MINKKRRIQIFYASIGSGHLIAARSIAQAISGLNPQIEVQLNDIFEKSGRLPIFQELATLFSNVLFPQLYNLVWKKGLLMWLYQIICVFSPMALTVKKYIANFNPDLIICTHSFPCSVISKYKEKKTTILLLAVPTDQYIHPYWPIKNVNIFIAPNQSMKTELIRRGMKSAQIFTFGIPVSVEMVPKTNYQYQDGKLSLLVLAGSYRLAPYLPIQGRVNELIHYLAKTPPRNVIWKFVFGKNRRLFKLAKKRIKNLRNVEILGFSNEIPHLMANSHAIVTKPGGLTVAESLALSKPLILLSKGTGQERANTEYVLSAGYGILLDTKEKLFEFIKSLERDVNVLKKNFRSPKYSYYNSALRIANLALALISNE